MWNDRAIAAGGILFAILTIPGYLMMGDGVAVGQGTNATAADWLADSGHRAMVLVGMYTMCAGGLAFLLFAMALAVRLRSAGSHPLLVGIIQAAGVAAAACQLVGAVGMATGALAIRMGLETTPPDPGVVRVTTFGAEVWLVPGLLCTSAFVAAVSGAIIERRAFPTWLALAGFLCAVVLLGGITFLPVAVLTLWAFAAAIVAIVRPASSVPAGSAAPVPA